MSLGYAEKLTFREDLGGQLGAPEFFDSPEEVDAKVSQLAALVQNAQRIVAFTGAGISTACGIPDFRGPSGVWTLQRAGKPIPRPKVSFAMARPSFTHAALVNLMESGKLTYIVSQNVDGLHLRSGVPRAKLAELHGSVFSERCVDCKTEYIRDFEVETVGFKATGRQCTACGGNLHDNVLDWEDALPVDELELSEQHARDANLAICLGTSLQITPACNLPLKTIRKYKDKEEAGKLVIINLQRTQHDKKAENSGGLVIRARVDDVMRLLMQKLQSPIPPFIRQDAVVVRHHVIANDREVKVAVQSKHGATAPLQIVRSVSFHFKGCPAPIVVEQQPFEVRRKFDEKEEDCIVRITLQLESGGMDGDGDAGKSNSVMMVYTAAKESFVGGGTSEGEQLWEFVSLIVRYEEDENEEEDGDDQRREKKPRIA